MTDILQLPGWTVTSTTDDGKRLVIRARLLFNNREPSKRQLRAKKAAAAEVPIMDMTMYRCACCEGLFMDDELAISHIEHFKPNPGFAAVPPDLLMRICANCNGRFHPWAIEHHSPLSTK